MFWCFGVQCSFWCWRLCQHQQRGGSGSGSSAACRCVLSLVVRSSRRSIAQYFSTQVVKPNIVMEMCAKNLAELQVRWFLRRCEDFLWKKISRLPWYVRPYDHTPNSVHVPVLVLVGAGIHQCKWTRGRSSVNDIVLISSMTTTTVILTTTTQQQRMLVLGKENGHSVHSRSPD